MNGPMNGRITIDVGADIEQTEDADVITRNENIFFAVTRLEGDATNRYRLIYRI